MRESTLISREAYSRQKARAKARSAVIMLAGQDIAPLPPVRDLARRQVVSRSDSV